MSRKTTVNRKFLEEQVRSLLKEVGPSGLVGPLSRPFDDERSATAAGKTLKKLPTLAKRIGLELIDVPVLIHKKVERMGDFDGSFYRQATRRAIFEFKQLKTFFALFEPKKSHMTSIQKFKRDYEEILDPDGYKVYDTLRKYIIDFGAKEKNGYIGNRTEFYRTLVLFVEPYDQGSFQGHSIIRPWSQIKDKVSDKSISFDEFVISLFKRSSDYSVSYIDAFDFLDQLKEEILSDIRSNKKALAEMLTFLVVAEIDPTMSFDLNLYTKDVFDQIEENPDIKPINIVRGIIQISIGVQVEKSIERRVLKRPLSFWRSLVLGFAVSLSLDLFDSYSSVGLGPVKTSRKEMDDIIDLLKLAEQGVRNIGSKNRDATEQEEEEIRKFMVDAIIIVRTQFNESLESEGLMMDRRDKIGAYEKLSQELDYATSFINPDNFSITKDNWKENAKAIQYLKNSLIQIYGKYKVSLSEFSPLEERLIQDLNQIDESFKIKFNIIEEEKKEKRKVGGLKKVKGTDLIIRPEEIKESGLTEEEINMIIESYGITSQNLYAKWENMSKLPQFTKKHIGISKNLKSRFNLEYKEWWERNVKKYSESLNRGEDPEKSRVKFLRPSARFEGLFHEFSGKGCFFPKTMLVSALGAPLIREKEDTKGKRTYKLFNSKMIGFDAKDTDRIVGELFKISEPGNQETIPSRLPFKEFIGTMKQPLDNVDGNKANLASEYLKNIQGNLKVVMAIRNMHIKVFTAVYGNALQIEQKALTAIDKLEATYQKSTNPDDYQVRQHDGIRDKYMAPVIAAFYVFGALESWSAKAGILLRKE